MKIGFLKHGSIVSASTRIRVDYVSKYLPNSIASNNIKDLMDCDAVIFQKRYKYEDVFFAQWLRERNRMVIFDLTDPVWDKDYLGCYFPITNDTHEAFKLMLAESNCVTFCTYKLEEMFNSCYKGFNTKVIPDRIDLECHKDSKIHDDKDKYIILWHGTKFSIDSINLAREDLEQLYKEIDFKLVIIREQGSTILRPFSFEVEYKIWDYTTINQEIIESDVTINPRIKDSYKSNNKTIKSWALGVPCVTEDFYFNLKYLLTSATNRNAEAKSMRLLINNHYDSRISAKELEELIENIKV
jgi:hypothetical protein